MPPTSLNAPLMLLNLQAAPCSSGRPGVHPARHNPQGPVCLQVLHPQLNTDHRATARGNQCLLLPALVPQLDALKETSSLRVIGTFIHKFMNLASSQQFQHSKERTLIAILLPVQHIPSLEGMFHIKESPVNGHTTNPPACQLLDNIITAVSQEGIAFSWV